MTAAGDSEAYEVNAIEKGASWTVGSIGYLVSTSWWNEWVRYSNYAGPASASAATLLPLPGSSPRPGPISNAELLHPSYTAATSQLPGAAITTVAAPAPRASPSSSAEDMPLRPGLVEQRDFIVVSAASWQRLHNWYGGGPAVARRVVPDAAPGPAGAITSSSTPNAVSGAASDSGRWTRLALYPLQLEVSYKPPAADSVKDGNGKDGGSGGGERSAVMLIDPEASLATLKARACAKLGVAESEVLLWDYTGGRAVQCLEVAAQDAAISGGGAAAAAASAVPLAVEADGPLAAPGTASTASVCASMDVDVYGAAFAAAATSRGTAAADGPVKAKAGKDGERGVMGQPLREVPLLEGQLLRLRRLDQADSDVEHADDDACGSDNENDSAPLGAGKEKASKKAAAAAAAVDGRTAPGEAAAAAAMRRASAAGSSRSDGGASGSGVPAPPASARTSGGGWTAFGASRQGGQRSAWNAWEDNVIPRDGQLPGLAGLSNLGNTCFMNSSLQCLAHAVPLMAAFLGGAYLQDVNRTNPLGMKGELAEAFGHLMEQLWRGDVSAVSPRSFKAKIGRFAPQFSGYAQHDSQEFLAFLLDGLHEDTNRIKHKPYIKEKDLSGRPDEEVAAEAWANYRARNDSLVVDHFQGLFKSTVDCPQCGFNSVKFDPFMYLSLPLPESRRRTVEVVLVRIDGSEPPCRMALDLGSGATLAELMQEVARAGGLPAEVVSSPDSHLLAARPLRMSPTTAHDELVLLTDGRMRLADALEAGGGGAGGASSYSLRSSAHNADSSLVLYYYPDAARGPRAEGLAPVIVHFKRPDCRATSWSRGVWCGAPLVLYLPADRPPYDPGRVAKVQLPTGSRYEWEVAGDWGDCPLATSLLEVLRPMQRLPIILQPSPPPPAEPEAAGEPAELARADSAQPAVAAAPMEEDDGPAAAAGGEGEEVALQPGTPAWDGDLAAADDATAAAGAGAGTGNGGPLQWCDGAGHAAVAVDGSESSGEAMEGLEPLVAADAAPAGGATGGGLAGGGHGGDASMPGTPQPPAYGPMEDDVGAAGPGALPPVIMAGPPESCGDLGPNTVQPFDMWAAQPEPSTWGAQGEGGAAAALAVPAGAAPSSGAPFSLKLCNSKGDSSLWGGSYNKEISVEHHREFLLLFSEACSAASSDPSPSAAAASTSAAPSAGGAVGVGPYAAELLDCPCEHPSLGEHRRRSAAGPQPVSLDDCMRTFLQPERLAESDAWYCPRCKLHVCADKKLDLWSLPEVLVVHLKRFSYTRFSRTKLDTRVDFPLHGLDLGPYVMRGQVVAPLYDLFAVSNHYGSMGGGHYTAYAKMPSPPPPPPPPLQQASPVTDGVEGDGAAGGASAAAAPEETWSSADRWYCFDDSHVSAVEPEAVRSPAAYVLFYRRRAEAAADPPGHEQLLERLRARREAMTQQLMQQQQAAGDGPSARDGLAAAGSAGGGGSPDSGSDRHPQTDQDHDHDQPDKSSRGGRNLLGVISIQAAARAAAAARGGDDGDGDDDGGGGAALAGPSSPTPMSVGNPQSLPGDDDGGGMPYGEYGSARAAYDEADYGAFIGGGCALMPPPGSPAEIEGDPNNVEDLDELYRDAAAAEQRSDAASAGENDDLDEEFEEELDAVGSA